MSDNEEVSPALTLKERWLREFWEAYARGGKDAANVLLGKLIDDMSTDDLTACFTPKIFRRILAEIIVPKLKRKFQEKAIPLGAVVFIDLDYFKRLNEKFGHAGGDEVLRVFGKKLREMFRVSDVIGRLGGDEFVIIADGLSVAMVEERIDKLKKELFIYPWKLDRIDGGKTSAGHELSFTAKLEEITNPDVLDELIRLADIALMKEKASRGQVE